ncbi:MAG: DUF6879 family protein [Pseudonocardiaceae bacterium]
MAPRLLAPDASEFDDCFCDSRYSIFRLETLQSYRSPSEAPQLEAFLAGRQRPITPGEREWVELVRDRSREGCVMQRVHVVTEPISDYMRFELAWSYPPHVAAGEDVRIIPVTEGGPWPADLPHRDFWFFDSSALFDMHYDPEGAWLGVEPVTDPARIVAACLARDAALHHATPWADYITARPQLARLVPAEAMPRMS